MSSFGLTSPEDRLIPSWETGSSLPVSTIGEPPLQQLGSMFWIRIVIPRNSNSGRSADSKLLTSYACKIPVVEGQSYSDNQCHLPQRHVHDEWNRDYCDLFVFSRYFIIWQKFPVETNILSKVVVVGGLHCCIQIAYDGILVQSSNALAKESAMLLLISAKISKVCFVLGFMFWYTWSKAALWSQNSEDLDFHLPGCAVSSSNQMMWMLLKTKHRSWRRCIILKWKLHFGIMRILLLCRNET